MKVFRTAVCAVIAALAATAMAQEAKKEGPKFEFHGFVGGSLYAQDAVFNNYGQGAFHVTKQPNQDKLLFGGDARQTRLNFSLAGPKPVFGGAIPKAVAELDFFSGLNTPQGGTGTVAVAPRLRLAYAELNWGPTIFRIGQTTDLVGGSFAPTSVGHIPQSVGYSAGYLGTRHLNADFIHTLPAGTDMKLELAFQVKASTTGTNDTFSGLQTAEAAGIPGFEARARLIVAKMLDTYVWGHWSQRDRNGQDNRLGSGTFGDTQNTVLGGAGVKVTQGPLTLQGQGYVGKNAGSEGFGGGIGQTPANNRGDAHEWGAWGQVGFNVTPEFSAWAFVGTERFTNFNDAITSFATATNPASAVRVSNLNYSAMLRYMEGGYALGLEYLHSHTRLGGVPADSRLAAPNGILDGNQLILSGMYFF